MANKFSRRKFLYLSAGAASLAGIGYVTRDHWLSMVTPKGTPTAASTPMPTMSPSPSPSDPVISEYGTRLPSEIIYRLRLLSADGPIDENERVLMEFLCDIEARRESFRSYGFEATDSEQYLIDVAADGDRVSDESGKAIQYMRKHLDKCPVELGFIGNSLARTNFDSLKELVSRDDISKVKPDLVFEISRTRDLKNKELTETVFNLYSSHQNAFDDLLAEGKAEGRRQCTALEALAWILLERGKAETEILLKLPRPRMLLVSQAWKKTNISKNYKSERWKDFDEVTDRLTTPQYVERYMQDNNFTYSYTPGELVLTKTAEEIFQYKTGACYDHALFAAYCLKKNGYDAKGMWVRFKMKLGYFSGHVVCIYQDPKDLLYYTIDSHYSNRICGPFMTIREAAEYSCRNQGLQIYSFLDVDLRTGKYVTRFFP